MVSSREQGAQEGKSYRLDTEARWTETNPGKEPRHLGLHVAKATLGAGLAIVAAIEELDHRDDQAVLGKLKTKYVPDLVILASMLAKVYEVDLNEAVRARSSEVAPR